jgi:hypothetical protein
MKLKNLVVLAAMLAFLSVPAFGSRTHKHKHPRAGYHGSHHVKYSHHVKRGTKPHHRLG